MSNEKLSNNREQFIKQLLIAYLKNEANEYSNWSQSSGNIVEYEYYTGVESGNPSGDKNIKTATYKDGSAIKLIQTFEYDSDNDIIKVEAQ